ncbi:hypothetical protein ONZ45_g4935 [Pleurotus djamor]|nr:hypothetical protein ONZ45_g4935 [Pleurotus djamor]
MSGAIIPPPKRQKTKKVKHRNKTKAQDKRRCLFETLPLEVLAEILMFCSSPKDLLAVARCSKHLCSTLTFEGNAFIWRSVRKNMYPGEMPDPLPNYTESSYAAFVFDSGPCDCHVSRPYASFALKVRFCFKSKCREELEKRFARIGPGHGGGKERHFNDWHITSEASSCFADPASRWYSYQVYISPDELRLAEAEWASAVLESRLPAYIAERNLATAAIQKRMEFYTRLYSWVDRHRVVRQSVKLQNDAFAKRKASAYGWEYWDLRTCKPFATLHQFQTYNMQVIRESDFQKIIGDVEAEMIAKFEEKRSRRVEASQEKLAQAVTTHYSRLKSLPKNAGRVFPNFAVFKALPAIVSLGQVSPDAKIDYGARLKSDGLLHKLLEDQLHQWVDKAKSDLGAILGSPGWKSATKKAVHPVERLNARFLCIHCESKPSRSNLVKPRSLTFKEACEHACPNLPATDKTPWDSEWFKVDTKAQNAIEQVLPKDYYNPFKTHVFSSIDENLFLCGSCEAAIVLGFSDIAEHAHRHDSMVVTSLSTREAAALLAKPREMGLTKRLFYGNGPLGKEEQNQKKLGCRHCTQRHKPSRVRTDQAEAEKEGKKEEKSPAVVKASFNGIRSHLKAKHGILVLRDEDIFCYDNDKP